MLSNDEFGPWYSNRFTGACGTFARDVGFARTRSVRCLYASCVTGNSQRDYDEIQEYYVHEAKFSTHVGPSFSSTNLIFDVKDPFSDGRQREARCLRTLYMEDTNVFGKCFCNQQ